MFVPNPYIAGTKERLSSNSEGSWVLCVLYNSNVDWPETEACVSSLFSVTTFVARWVREPCDQLPAGPRASCRIGVFVISSTAICRLPAVGVHDPGLSCDNPS